MIGNAVDNINKLRTVSTLDDTEIDRSGLEQLAAVYGLLAHLWIKEVDQPMLDALNDPQLKSVFESLGGHVPTDNSPAVVEQLAVDYCQLLIGPKGHISPIQSIWEKGQFETASAASMQKYFELLPGYRPPTSIKDHIGNQFDFLGELFARAATGDHPETFTRIATLFFEEHMEWTHPFFDKVESQAETDFYRGLARLTRNFLQQ